MKILLAAVCALSLSACATRNIVIPADLSPEKLVQLAQEESDKNRYNAAAQYYKAILERFPDNIAAVCGAQYEIAFIHYKQKKYAESEEEFNALIDRYNAPDGDLLPQKYYILSNIALESINKTLFKSDGKADKTAKT
jgi:outer membrane protein assembly factor BamD (BamD/ComL family)